MNNKNKPAAQTQEISKTGISLELFLGNTKREQINTLHNLKDTISDVLINYVHDEDGSLSHDTIKNLTAIYMQANCMVSRMKAA